MIKKDLKRGFSLAELLVVMVVAAIVLAVSAPMITRKASNANLGAEAVFAPINDLAVRYVSGKEQRIYMPDGSSGTGIVGKDKEIPKKSVVLGTFTQLPKEDVISIGYNTALRKGSIVIGNNSKTRDNTTTEPADSIVIGNDSEAATHNAVVIGNNLNANNATGSVTIGHIANTGEGGVAIGDWASSSGSSHTVAIGYHTNVDDTLGRRLDAGNSSIAIGNQAKAGSVGSIAIGYQTNSTAIDELVTDSYVPGHTIVIGSSAKATADHGIAIGISSEANGANGIAIGNGAKVDALSPKDKDGNRHKVKRATAIGAGAVANHSNTIVLGTADDTVIIPGRLVVKEHLIVHKRSLLGYNAIKGNNYEAMTCIGRATGVGTFFGSGIDCIEDLRMDNYVTPDSVVDFGTGYSFPTGIHMVSDRRLKNVGDKFTGGLDELNKLDLYHYTFKDDKDKTPHIGVMAQDLQKVFPDAVTEGKDGFLRIRMEDMFYAVINAVKELHQKVAAVCANVEQLTKDFGDMQTQLTEQKKQIADLQKQVEEQKKINEEQNKRFADLEKQIRKLKK